LNELVLNEPHGFRPFARSELAQSIADRFERQVDMGPDRLAVRCGEATATYAELNAWANRIAHATLVAAADRALPVAIVLGQGIALIAAVLGALKAGTPYVPLEPTWQRKRLAAALADCGAGIAIAEAASLPLLCDLAGRELRGIDPLRIDPSMRSTNPACSISPDAPAYIYYTTGTTGAAKGVVDTHRNVLHNVMRYTNALRIAADDRLTLLQSPGFSGAVSSMFAALLNGAASFPFDVRASSSAELADYLRRERITIYHSVPTIFRSFLRGDLEFPSVRIVRLEGDRATSLDVQLFRRHFGPHCVLAHGLGTTETGLACQHLIGRDDPPATGVVPVGVAVEDMEVLVVDEAGRSVPAGDTGEIAICSDYLASGYWRRPDLASRAFLAAPDAHGKRMYRTGDLGRLRPDGGLEHLGRMDSRTKIRGESVDLADVEAALYRLPTIREAAVVARRDELGEVRLQACYVAASPHAPTTSALRKALATILPPPSIPTWFEPVDALPLNENLKIDRGALPPRSTERPRLDVPYAAAQDPTQAAIVRVWETLLAIAPVGIRDAFADLGGDSLQAAQMVSRVSDALGVEVPISLLASGETIADLAAAIARHGASARDVVPLREGGTQPRFYFLHGDYLGAGAYCHAIARCLHADQPFFALPPCGIDGGIALDNVEDMAERHLAALRRHQPHGSYRLGGNCNGGLIALEMAARLVADGERVDRLVIFRTSAKNARWRPLIEPIDRVVRWCDGRPMTRRAVTRRMRWLAEAWSSAEPAGRLRLVAGKVVRMTRLFEGSRRAGTRRAGAALGTRQPTPPTSAADRAALVAAFGTAAADYVPRRYGGRIDLVWPEEDAESPVDAATAWRAVSPDVRLDVVRGNHLTAITIHAREFAQCLARRLADDSGATRPDALATAGDA
jgi:amino acid adenylation domain-containing protein